MKLKHTKREYTIIEIILQRKNLVKFLPDLPEYDKVRKKESTCKYREFKCSGFEVLKKRKNR